MSSRKIGKQTIGCHVSSCKYNDGSSYCELSQIEVQPCQDCRSHTGRPADESLCGSYCSRD